MNLFLLPYQAWSLALECRNFRDGLSPWAQWLVQGSCKVGSGFKCNSWGQCDGVFFFFWLRMPQQVAETAEPEVQQPVCICVPFLYTSYQVWNHLRIYRRCHELSVLFIGCILTLHLSGINLAGMRQRDFLPGGMYGGRGVPLLVDMQPEALQ